MLLHLTSVVMAILAVAPGPQGGKEPAAPEARFVGSWLSEGAGFTNLTTIYADGRFRTERMAGIRVVETFTGRWQLRGNAIAWSYDGAVRDPKAPEDVNPIVLERPDRLSLREVDGSLSVLFRKGVPEPLAPQRIPIAIGTGWVFKDELGEFAIRVTARERVGDRDCYRVDWIMGDEAYQSEYWSVDEEGIHVTGRRVLGKRLDFSTPYLLVKRVLVAGDKWRASVIVDGRPQDVSISVGAEETVSTPAGRFQALPVTLAGQSMSYVRWYAPGVGLVREDVSVAGEPLNTKLLQRRLE